MSLLWVMGAFGPSARVQVSGQNVNGQVEGAASQAGIRVNSDGTIDENSDAIYGQIDAATDWIRPQTPAPGDFEARITGFTGDGLEVADLAIGTFGVISESPQWYLETSIVEVRTCTFTLEIRKGSGPVISSASYTLTCETT